MFGRDGFAVQKAFKELFFGLFCWWPRDFRQQCNSRYNEQKNGKKVKRHGYCHPQFLANLSCLGPRTQTCRLLQRADCCAAIMGHSYRLSKKLHSLRWLWPRNCVRGPTAKPRCIAFTRRCSAQVTQEGEMIELAQIPSDTMIFITTAVLGFGGNADRAEMAPSLPASPIFRPGYAMKLCSRTGCGWAPTSGRILHSARLGKLGKIGRL
jgi:hypothetical protein